MHIKFSFKWYDLWVGFYYDVKYKALYICPLPCCVFTITRKYWHEKLIGKKVELRNYNRKQGTVVGILPLSAYGPDGPQVEVVYDEGGTGWPYVNDLDIVED